MENHPDRLVGAGPEVRERADQVRKLIDDAATVLLNDTARPLFDAALERFEAEDPKLVSADGGARLNLKRGRVDLDYLVRGTVYDTASLEEQAVKLSGFSERRLKSARRDHQENPDDAEALDVLRDELTTQCAMLTLMEDYAWMRADIRGRHTKPDPILYASDYAEAVGRHIEEVSDILIRKRPRHATRQSSSVSPGRPCCWPDPKAPLRTRPRHHGRCRRRGKGDLFAALRRHQGYRASQAGMPRGVGPPRPDDTRRGRWRLRPLDPLSRDWRLAMSASTSQRWRSGSPPNGTG